MKTEVERRSRAQASNPKSPVDVGGRTYWTGILINERIHPAFEKLPEGLKLEKEFAARLEPDRLEASDAADDEALGPRNALRQMNVTYTPDGRQVRDWDRHILREKRRLQAEAEQDDEIVREAQRYVDLEDNPAMADALAVKARQEREQSEMELKLRTEALELARRSTNHPHWPTRLQPKKSVEDRYFSSPDLTTAAEAGNHPHRLPAGAQAS